MATAENKVANTKHTPRPWTIGGLQAPEFGPDDLLIEIRVEGYGPVAYVDGTPQGEETTANARLIAAAPELLAQICALVVQIETIPELRVPPSVRAVIAKATGEDAPPA